MDTQEKEVHEEKSRDIMLPASIIVAALLISGSWIYTTGIKNTDLGAEAKKTVTQEEEVGKNMKPVSREDHIRGTSDAPIMIVEYSDLECPFCKRFHATLQQIINEYSGQVAWVYRHFPLDSLHPIKARKGAEAAECAGELGGEEKFWAFIDRYFEITPSNNQFDMAQLPVIADTIGLDRAAFTKCTESGKYAAKVEAQAQDAAAAGATGTPFSIIITKDGKKFPVNGALPYAQIKSFIDQALK